MEFNYSENRNRESQNVLSLLLQIQFFWEINKIHFIRNWADENLTTA